MVGHESLNPIIDDAKINKPWRFIELVDYEKTGKNG